MAMTETDLPLAGIRVLDLTTVVFGPYAAQTLGDLGADVIKVEAPGGDQTRAVGAARNDGMGALFLGSNRNKRSIELDLKDPDHTQALWRLIATADVFMHNIRPQKIKALGFDAHSVRAHSASIVYAGLHGYWETGPYGGSPAYDDVVQGQSGYAGAAAARDGTPSLAPSVIADKTAGLMAVNAILAALLKRRSTGKGTYVEIGMFEGLTSFNLVEHLQGESFDPPEGPPGYARTLSPGRRPHPTQDGHICMLAYTDQAMGRLLDPGRGPGKCVGPALFLHGRAQPEHRHAVRRGRRPSGPANLRRLAASAEGKRHPVRPGQPVGRPEGRSAPARGRFLQAV